MKTVLLGALLAASFLLALAALVKWADRARAESTSSQTVPNRVTDSYQIGKYTYVTEFRDGLNRTCVMVFTGSTGTALSCGWPKGY